MMSRSPISRRSREKSSSSPLARRNGCSTMIPTIAALFVDSRGIYSHFQGVDVWCEERDARRYPGQHPVVAHPPCQRWGALAKACYGRYPRDEFRVGNDGGCFESALASVRQFGGVLEHPARSLAWESFDLVEPIGIGWQMTLAGDWVCEVWQSAYGHLARKATWLLYCGDIPPMAMRWERRPGTHQIGYQDSRGKSRNKPPLAGKRASATPPEFAAALIDLARNARVTPAKRGSQG